MLKASEIKEIAKLWEENLTDEEYLQLFGSIRRKSPPAEKSKPNESQSTVKNHTDHMTSKHNEKVNADVTRIPTRPANPAPTKSNHFKRPDWIDPMRIDYSNDRPGRTIRKPTMIPSHQLQIKSSVPESSADAIIDKLATNRPAENQPSHSVSDETSNEDENSDIKHSFTESSKKKKKKPARLPIATNIPSKPLQWSIQFGNQGRKASLRRKTNRLKLARKPLPPKEEDLIVLLKSILTEVMIKYSNSLKALIPNPLDHIHSRSADDKQQIDRIISHIGGLNLEEQLGDASGFHPSSLPSTTDNRLYLHNLRDDWLTKYNDKLKKLSSNSEGDRGDALKTLLLLFGAVPNVRPSSEVLSIVSYLLSQWSAEDPKSDSLSIDETLSAVMKSFTAVLDEAKVNLSSIADRKVDRSSIAEGRSNRDLYSHNTTCLQRWYEKSVVRLNDQQSIDETESDNNKLDENFANDHQSRSVFTISTSKSGCAPPDATIQAVPNKPLAARAIAPLGKSRHIILPESLMTSARSIRLREPFQSVNVFHHIQRQRFVNAIGWKDENRLGKLVALSKTSRVNMMSLIDNIYDIPFNISDAQPAQDEEFTDKVTMTTPANDSSTIDGRCLSTYMLSNDIILSKQQALGLLIGITSDVIYAFTLNILALVKHAWAGKLLEFPHLLTVMRTSLAVIDTKSVVRLHKWLQSNRKTNATFKVHAETHLELALQQAISYWPQLALKRCPSYANEAATCVVRLVWPDKRRIIDLFRDPNMFEPNVNCI